MSGVHSLHVERNSRGEFYPVVDGVPYVDTTHLASSTEREAWERGRQITRSLDRIAEIAKRRRQSHDRRA